MDNEEQMQMALSVLQTSECSSINVSAAQFSNDASPRKSQSSSCCNSTVSHKTLARWISLCYYRKPGYSCILPIKDLSLIQVDDKEVPFNFVTLYDKIRVALSDRGLLQYNKYLKKTLGLA
ncbi:hypothetical protein V1515DRAFT_612400 [Lipomyces mesembrius]